MGASGRMTAKRPPLVFSKSILHGGEKWEDRSQACCDSDRRAPCNEQYGSNGYRSNQLAQGEMDNQNVGTTQRT